MADSAIALLVPEECPSCRARGRTRLETTVTGSRVVLMWVCPLCEHEWPVISGETTPARLTDR